MKKLSLKAAIWPGFLPIFSKVRDGVIPFRDSLAAYERTWTKFLACAAAASFGPRALSLLPPWRLIGF
jgi:hypothetical protein